MLSSAAAEPMKSVEIVSTEVMPAEGVKKPRRIFALSVSESMKSLVDFT